MLGKTVLILPDKMPEMTDGGIIIPDIHDERKSKEMPQTGVVVDCGPECEHVEKGNRVHFARRSASIIEIDGVVHFVTMEDWNKIFYIE